MSCINKNSKLITNISDKLGLKPIVVSSQLAVFSEKNNISLDDKDIESKFVEYLSTSDKHKHLNIRELNTDNKSTINVEGDVKQSIINSIKNAKESEDKVYISNDVLDKLQDSKDVLNEINDTIGIPDNVILPYSVEMRPITTSKILSKLKSKQDIYIKFTPEERKRRVDLLANLFVERVSQLNEAQPNKSRIDIIQEYNPSEIFNDIKNEFKGLLDSDIDQSIKDKVSKIIDHFSDLSKLSANKIGWEENIKLSTVDTTDSYNKYNNPNLP